MMLGRKNKKGAVITQEKTLLYKDGELVGKGHQVSRRVAAYNEAAKFFEKNMAQLEKKRASTWRGVAVLSWALCIVLGIALACLAPLKTVIPYVLRVDMNSGFVDVVKPASESKESPEVKEDKRNLTALVMAMESYNWASQPANYHLVQVMSHAPVFEPYRRFQLSPKGYVATMAQNQQFRVVVNGFVPIKNASDPRLVQKEGVKTYQVRFTKTLLDDNNNPVAGVEPTRWVSVISFDYNNAPLTEGDDWLNPRGFGAWSYAKSQEVNRG